jgi:ADP-ribose pyrophosphatase
MSAEQGGDRPDRAGWPEPIGCDDPTQPEDALVERFEGGESVYLGHFLHVRRDRVRLPDGALAGREYVRHPGAVMVVPLLDAHTAVIERQFRYPIGRVMIEFPAGKLDPHEGAWACAQRELEEETGYLASQWARAGLTHNAMAYSDEGIEIWFARGLFCGKQQLDPGEFLAVHRATLADLQAWSLQGVLTDAKTLTGMLWWEFLLRGQWQPQWLTLECQGL